MSQKEAEPLQGFEGKTLAGNVEIVIPNPDDWQNLRDLKIKSLEQEPLAFEDPIPGIEKFRNRTEAEWRSIMAGQMSGERVGETLIFMAKAGNQVIGMVQAIIPEDQDSTEKKATIEHMYVDAEDYRGLGIGRQLVTTLLDKLRAKGDVKRVELGVVVTQVPARNLYESLGFKAVRIDQQSAKRGNEQYDQIEMELRF